MDLLSRESGKPRGKAVNREVKAGNREVKADSLSAAVEELKFVRPPDAFQHGGVPPQALHHVEELLRARVRSNLARNSP